MFQRIAIAAAVGLCCTSARAEAPKTAPTAAQRKVEVIDPETSLTLKKLAAVVPYVHLDNAMLSDAIDELRKVSGAEIFVNWKELEVIGLMRDTKITLRLINKRFSTVLDLTLAIAGAERPPLGYTVSDGVITISTAHDLARNTVTRVYDARVIIDAPGRPGRNVRVGSLLKLIMDAVDPQSWRARDGDIGSIRELQGQLIVTQTAVNQAKIALLVTNLVALHGGGEPGK
jgi:hypothetical protein